MNDDRELLRTFGPCPFCGAPQESYFEERDGNYETGIRCTRWQKHRMPRRASLPLRLWRRFGLAAAIPSTLACMWVLAR